MSERDPFATYRTRMDALGFQPSRRLGQNFLLAPELHRLIADAGQVGPADIALEVGAGLGFLTRELAARAAIVVAVEIDPRLCQLLREDLSGLPDGKKVVLVPGDVLAGKSALAPAVGDAIAQARASHPGAALRVVANLPYAVTGPALAALICDLEPIPATMAILIQAEVGERLCAEPGTAAYGSLSVLVQTRYRPRQVRRVGSEVFRPRPNVDSVIVALEAGPTGEPDPRAPGERRAFANFVRALFSGRRKKVRHSFPLACAAAGLTAASGGPRGEAGPAPEPWGEMRPAEMSAAAFAELWVATRAET